jgi:hypothetical protein
VRDDSEQRELLVRDFLVSVSPTKIIFVSSERGRIVHANSHKRQESSSYVTKQDQSNKLFGIQGY